jgi:LEA14-like dessication related protein
VNQLSLIPTSIDVIPQICPLARKPQTISSVMSRLALALAVVVGIAVTACTGAQSPSLRVLGVHESKRNEVVFVQVTNPASRPMRLTQLEYTFASEGTTVSTGTVRLANELPANSAIVVEVPLTGEPPDGALVLRGKLTATVDQIVKSFSVSAQIQAE